MDEQYIKAFSFPAPDQDVKPFSGPRQQRGLQPFANVDSLDWGRKKSGPTRKRLRPFMAATGTEAGASEESLVAAFSARADEQSESAVKQQQESVTDDPVTESGAVSESGSEAKAKTAPVQETDDVQSWPDEATQVRAVADSNEAVADTGQSAEPLVSSVQPEVPPVEPKVADEPSSLAAQTLQKALNEQFQLGLEQGRQEAEQKLLTELRQQAYEQGLAEGRETGYQQGIQEGLEGSAAVLQERAGTLEQAASQIDDYKQLLNHQQVLDAARLLESLLLEVVRVELRHSPQQIARVVEEAVRLLDRPEREPVSLRVHPDDSGWLQEFVNNSLDTFVVCPDSAITRGGCRVESRVGDVDATVEERLTDCITQLRNCLLENPEEAGAIDLSPVYEPAVTQTESEALVKPLAPAQPVSKIIQVPVKPVQPEPQPAVFNTEPATSDEAGLGAWGDLGQ